MNKGVILDITKNYLVMLTPNGEFVKGKKTGSDYNVGQEIHFHPYSNGNMQKRSIISLWPFAATLASVVFISFVLLNPFSNNKAYAYVTMDMNPSIELVLDKQLKVIETHAYNESGEQLLSEIEIDKKEPFSNVAKRVMVKCDSMGYLDDHSNIVISSVATEDDSKKRKDLEKEVESLKPVADKMEANIKVVKASVKERKSAVKKGVSTGEFVVEKHKKHDKKVVPQEKMHQRVNQVQEEPNKIKKANKGTVKTERTSDFKKSGMGKDLKINSSEKKEKINNHAKRNRNHANANKDIKKEENKYKKNRDNHLKQDKNFKEGKKNKHE